MTDEHPKSDAREVEWSFDFANLGESFKKLLDSLAGEEEVQTSHLHVPKSGINRADIAINFSVGSGALRVLAGGDNLLEATLVHVGEIDLTNTGDSTRHIELKQKMKPSSFAAPIRQGLRALVNRTELKWDIALAPDVPTFLKIDGGVGPVTVDLTGMTLSGLDVDNSVGSLHLTLPATDAGYTTKVDGGVGEVVIQVPSGASGRLDIDGGVGAIEVIVAADAAVRLEAETGIGSIQVPAELVRVDEHGDFTHRTWQTPGFDLAGSRLIIKYDGGVGQLRVRVADTV